jgi:glycosyltransferase involved in cell wall biosynthesis
MKVGIDTFGCEHGRSGLGSYLCSLTANLRNDADVEFNLFGAELDRYTYASERAFPYDGVTLFESSAAERLWHIMCANNFASKHKYDVVLYTAASQMIPVTFSVPGVAIVNDIVSDSLSAKHNAWSSFHIKRGLAHADRVIVASQYIRKDLEKIGIDPEKIAVIHNGIDHSSFYPRELLSPNLVDIKPFAIQRPYFIYASRMSSPTKKHVELIRAFTLFKEKTHLPHRLVLAGSEGPYSDAVHDEVFNSHAASDIFITGFFPHENFPELYSGSDGCIFPSVSEGVGLPVLEAMATGIPVACAKSGALSEIAGDNAIYFDSDNIEEMAAAMETLALDKAKCKTLITGGIEWTKRFSWEKTAQMTTDVLKEVVKATCAREE